MNERPRSNVSVAAMWSSVQFTDQLYFGQICHFQYGGGADVWRNGVMRIFAIFVFKCLQANMLNQASIYTELYAVL